MNSHNERADIVIVGAGPVGAFAALALAQVQSPHRVRLLDAAPLNAPTVERTLALSYGSRLLLERIGVWDAISPAPQPIESIDVQQREGAGHAMIHARECGVPALGYTLQYAALTRALDDALARAPIELTRNAKATRVRVDPHCATIELESGECVDCAQIVVADGGSLALPGMKAFTRDHGQTAVVAHVRAEKPKPTLAFERFSTQGPIALLPLDANGTYGLVWTQAHANAPALLNLASSQFEAQLQTEFGDALGALTLANTPRSYPLGLKLIEPRVSARLVAIGNAAQAMHPIAGQGLNLGLRDAQALAETLACLPAARLGERLPLMKYALARGPDRVGGVLMTESLVSIFGLRAPLAIHARGAGLAGFDALGPIKRAVARRMIFGG